MQNMKSHRILSYVFLICVITIFSSPKVEGQAKPEEGFLGKAELYKSKKQAHDFLADPAIMEKFGKISDAIWGYAELGLQEFKSSALLIKTLEEEGFTVEKNVAGMPTCFVATWGSGKPVIGLLGEFDALPMISQKARTPTQDPVLEGGPGHGCGHNTMGTAAVAACIAVKRSMQENKIPGTIKFYGSPAEETIISRPYMVRAGVFKDVDAVIDNHGGSALETAYGVHNSAMYSVLFTFKGKTSHAAGSPWTARSALDAVEIMNISTNFLREHLHFSHRMHYVVVEGGEAPNVVPDKASVWYYIRNTDENLEEMYKRVMDCAKGAALATNTTLDGVRVLTATHQKHSNRGMAEAIQRNMELVGMPAWTNEENEFAKALQKELGAKEQGFPVTVNKLKAPAAQFSGGGSSDVGEVTLIAPTATLNFPGMAPGSLGHHWSAVACTYGSAAWKGLNTGAKVMAGTALDLFTKPAMLSKIREEFTAYSKEHPYKSFLPEDATPPLDLNKELMDKYRARLEEISNNNQ